MPGQPPAEPGAPLAGRHYQPDLADASDQPTAGELADDVVTTECYPPPVIVYAPPRAQGHRQGCSSVVAATAPARTAMNQRGTHNASPSVIRGESVPNGSGVTQNPSPRNAPHRTRQREREGAGTANPSITHCYLKPSNLRGLSQRICSRSASDATQTLNKLSCSASVVDCSGLRNGQSEPQRQRSTPNSATIAFANGSTSSCG